MEKTLDGKLSDPQYIKMTETPVPLLVSKLAVPTTVSMLVSSVYNMADTYFVSQLNDTSATGAVGVVFALMAMIQAVGFTVGMGAGSWISRLLGQKRNSDANTVAISALVMGILFGSVIMVFGKMFSDTLMIMLGATKTILPYANAYGQYILFAAPVMSATYVLNNLLRAEGKATFSMIGIGLGGIINIILDPVFIFDFGFGMKTAGAALATAISQCISFTLLLFPFILGKTTVRLNIMKLSTKISDYANIIKFGLPSFCRQGLSSASSVVLSNSAKVFAGVHADAAIAGMGVVSRVFMFVFSLCLGLGQGYMPVLGYNYGAKKYERVKKAFNFTLYASTAMFVIAAAAGFIFAPDIISIFSNGEGGTKMLEVGTAAFRAQCISMPFIPLGVMSNMTYQSLGRSLTSTFLSCLRQGLFYIPVMLILPRFIGLPGVEYTQAIADLLTSAVSVIFVVKFLSEITALIKTSGTEEKCDA
ncbi:MAG: MATE family efflux transporter [Clostridia bacterium]|nr:MATE family efflux transporter [Clostridia bacterium]